jgi:hypothetical protein
LKKEGKGVSLFHVLIDCFVAACSTDGSRNPLALFDETRCEQVTSSPLEKLSCDDLLMMNLLLATAWAGGRKKKFLVRRP